MPFKRKYRKRPYKKKRFVKRRKFRRTGTSTFARTTTPFPYKLSTKLKYHTNTNFNPAAITYSHNWNANSLFDPDRTGTGHQPLYFDQLCPTVYNRYRVKAFSYRAVISGANTPLKVQFHFQNNNNSNDYEDLGEAVGTKQTIVNAMASGGKCISYVKGYCSLKRLLGQSTNDDRDQAVYNSSPTNVCILGMLLTSLDGSTNISAFNLDLTFTYYCDLFDRIITSGS